jgi:DNA-binding NarL/FixJ family response regulator/tRNA A-37 threonylcarbamoyl transferase component Bud32
VPVFADGKPLNEPGVDMSIIHQGLAPITSGSTIRVLLVEDQEVLRLGLRLSFQDLTDIEMVAEAADGPSAVEQAIAYRPSLVLMDIALPGFDGIVATRKIKAALPGTRILVLSSHGEDEYVFPALEAGADGYCLKDVSRDTLLTAIRTVNDGHTWLDDTVANRLLRTLRRVDPEVTSQNYQLSETEMNVLYCVLEGTPIEDISEQLGIPSNKVHAYTRRVLHKIANTSEASESIPKVNDRPRRITTDHQLSRICSRCKAKLPVDSDVCPFDGADTKADKMVGTTFADRYEILSVLGSGSGGTVYKARHRFMNRLAAIKVMHPELMPDLDLLQRFRQEAAAANSLEHSNVIRVIDFGVANDGTAFMIQEFVDGPTLREIIDMEGAIPAPLAVEMFKQICLGMGFAHRSGIVHRDLKPSNVLVSGYGTLDMRVKIADFGVAKLVRPNQNNPVRTELGLVIGSPLYMSPEQCRGHVLDKRADIYSMGCLMYETLTGRPPFVGKDVMEVMFQHVNCEVPNIASTQIGMHLPAILNGIVMKALRKEANTRYRSMEELMVYLDGAVI